MRVPTSKDTRLFVVGVVALLALLVYLGVAFAATHPTSGVAGSKTAPWTPVASRLAAVPLRKGQGYAVRVTPTGRGSSYGAVVQTLVTDPTPGARYTVGLWLRGAQPGKVAVELNEFRPGVARYPVETTVPATPRWHHFTFSVRVRGTWLGLATYVYRVDKHRRTWFALRGLTASLRRG